MGQNATIKNLPCFVMIQCGQLCYAVDQCKTMKIRCFGKKKLFTGKEYCAEKLRSNFNECAIHGAKYAGETIYMIQIV